MAVARSDEQKIVSALLAGYPTAIMISTTTGVRRDRIDRFLLHLDKGKYIHYMANDWFYVTDKGEEYFLRKYGMKKKFADFRSKVPKYLRGYL